MVYSASIAMAESSVHTGYRAWYFLVRHAVFVAVGVIAAYIAFQVPMKGWQRLAVWLFIGGAVLLSTFMLNQGCRWDLSARCGADWLNGGFGVAMINGQFGNLLLFAIFSRRLTFSRNLVASALFLAIVYILLPRIVFGSAYADMRLAPYIFANSITQFTGYPKAIATVADLLATADLEET